MTSAEMVFEKIMGDSQLVEDFLELESVDEMYEFCVELDPNLTKDEFDDYVSDVLEVYAEQSEGELEPSAFSKVAGGTGPQMQESVLPLTPSAPVSAANTDDLSTKGWKKTAGKIKKLSFAASFGSMSLPAAVLRGSALK